MLASPRFQHFAARCWLTRPVARARARDLFDLVAGFVYSQTLAACLSTGLLDRLAAGPATTDSLAAAIDLPREGTLRLLRAAAALDLVERLDADWALGPAGAALRGNRGIAEMVAHHALLYADLADPVALLRRGGGGGALSHYWTYASGDESAEGDVAPYSRLMAASQPLVAAQILESYRFAHHRRVLDVGGGEGRFLESVGAAVPGLARGLFDLPAVAERARTRLGSGVELHFGDFHQDPIPTGYDLITLVRVLHDHDDAPALALLRAVFAALPPGGRVLVGEPMADTPGARRAGDAYFGFYLLAMGSGRPRSAAEIIAMLRTVGFSGARVLPTAIPLTCRTILATRPARRQS
ncbi:methyltransferase [Sphingomonas sp. RB3P16]|uniref:methyltransferase n=1 Tax=Parasphingomonas frigoris TaxID=3096163 RepID=UPI002FC8B113